MSAFSVSSRISVPGATPQVSVSCATVSGSVLPRVEAARRDVHRHRQVEAGVAPLALLVQGLVEHPGRERLDQLAARRLGHELRGLSGARPVGCCQRTSASTPVVRRVVRSTLGWKCRMSSPRGMPSRSSLSSVSRRAVGSSGSATKTPSAAAGLLGLAHRQRGAAQQVGGGAAVLREEGDPDARPHVDDVAADQERLLEGRADLPGDRLGRLDVGLVGREDAELVAAQARHRVRVADRVAEPLRDRLEQDVAVLAPELSR